MSETGIPDSGHRQRALDIDGSFIVQAPAGSGKTELLILRYMKLLCVCEQPEQVLAITFTRKAANEMSQRIIAALRWAQAIDAGAELPTEPLELQRLEMARAVLQHDKHNSWHLLDYPSRLRVQTIDSFCSYLAAQLPILSRLGGHPNISDDVSLCFSDAVTNTLALLEAGIPLSDDIACLLGHLDNDMGTVERLLVNLLANRDQWLPFVLEIRQDQEDSALFLQQSLQELISESLEQLGAELLLWESRLIPLINHALANRQAAGETALQDLAPLAALPEPTAADLAYWQLLANLLLVKNDPAWRKTVDVRSGFPASHKTDKALSALYKARKQDMVALLGELSEQPLLLSALAYVRLLPDPALETNQWQFLGALTRVLAQLSSELLLSFRRFRVVDYVQTSTAARGALGTEDAPTDLALVLDHRIQHILVDEFQDTSQLQLEILQQITAGWVDGDGRTLFLVGDAMQSCYGFRNANVGIYLNVQENGLGDISLTPLTLEANFRSQQQVVGWVNEVFGAAFPETPNISRGAVPYTHSTAIKPALDTLGVRVELIGYQPDEQERAKETEALTIVARIQALQRLCPGQSIAILVRARSHLRTIVPALRVAGIQWQATDIDRLSTLPVIEDLLSLTRALLNQADRLSWLALLRAPWCGLTVADLHAITRHAGDASIWSALQDVAAIPALSSDGRERLTGLWPILELGMTLRGRAGLRQRVETCWRLLGAAHTVTSPAELDSAAHYFTLLSEQELAGGLADVDAFAERVAAAFVPSRAELDQPDHGQIHLLTMHKAKGLEFDHVLLPGLGQKSQSDGKPLLQWHSRLNAAGDPRLFIATLSATGSDDDRLYKLLQFEQQQKALLENTRLLYIAVTRARSSVTLYGTLAEDESGALKAPAGGSLLARIWPQLETIAPAPQRVNIESAENPALRAALHVTYPEQTPIRRFASPWRLTPDTAVAVAARVAHMRSEQELEPPAREPEASIGTLVHRSLEAIARSGDLVLTTERLARLRSQWRLQLQNLLTEEAALAAQLQFIENAVQMTLGNAASRWIFDASLRDNQSELALSRYEGGQLRHYKIDRSFIDTEGVRWIIDYKTATPASDEEEEHFIRAQCVQHAGQLAAYRGLFQQMESRPIKTALYFTGLGRLVEVPAA